MSDCMDFNCAPAATCSEGVCFSNECWGPSCCDAGFSSASFATACSDNSVSRTSATLDMNTTSLYGSAATDNLSRGTMDSHKSASDLVQEGTFVQSNKAPRADQTERTAGEQPKIIVTNDNTVTPDYIVRQDGKVEVVGNPDAGDKAHGVYRVQVEPGANQQTTENLVNYLNDRIHAKEASAAPQLLADPGLVSEETSRKFNSAPAPDSQNNPQDQPPQDSPPPDDGGSCPGGGCPGGGGGGDCPSDTSPPQDNPTPSDNTTPPENNQPAPESFAPQLPMDNILDAARLNSWDNNTAGALGAYEVNMSNWFSSWLDADMLEELGHPPDFKKLGKVLAKAKNNPKFKEAMDSRLNNMREQGDNAGADKINDLFNKLTDPKETAFQENFGVFLNSQQPGGRNATGEEMASFMDKDMQRAIASSRISDIAHQAGIKVKDLPADTASKLALAGALGHVPNEKEMTDYAQYVQAIQSKYKAPKGG